MEGTVVNNYFTPLAVARNRVEDYLRNSLGVQSAVITTFVLRLQAVLTSTDNSFEMQIVKGQTDRKNETKLAVNDLFFTTDFALLIGKEKAAGGGASALYAAPDPAFFSTAGESAALMTAYNGLLALEDSHRKRFYDFQTASFYFKPQVGYKAAVTGTGATPEQLPQFAWSDVKVGFEPFEILSGQADTKVKLQLGDGTRTAIAGDTSGGLTNVVNVFAFGFRVADMAKKYDDYVLRLK